MRKPEISAPFGLVVVSLFLLSGMIIGTVVLAEPVLSQKSSEVDSIPFSSVIEAIQTRPQSELRVVENPDSPLRILSARVIDIDSEEFRQFTGKIVTVPYISSVPEVEVVNVSDKIITNFMIVVRNPDTQSMRAIQIPRLRILPNEQFVLQRHDFVPQATTAIADNLGIRKSHGQFDFGSESSWLTLGSRSDLYITVGIVGFSDGSKWMIKEGGEVQ